MSAALAYTADEGWHLLPPLESAVLADVARAHDRLEQGYTPSHVARKVGHAATFEALGLIDDQLVTR